MKFKSKSANTVVRYKGKELCRFENYRLETADPSVIEVLKNLGYEVVEGGRETETDNKERYEAETESEEKEVGELDRLNVKELQQRCKEEGITYRGKNKQELINALREGD